MQNIFYKSIDMNEEQIKEMRECMEAVKRKHFYSVESTRKWFEESGFGEKLKRIMAWGDEVRKNREKEKESEV